MFQSLKSNILEIPDDLIIFTSEDCGFILIDGSNRTMDDFINFKIGINLFKTFEKALDHFEQEKLKNINRLKNKITKLSNRKPLLEKLNYDDLNYYRSRID